VTGLLDNEIAVVTGGSRGIGQAVVLRLALEGARVAILDLISPHETEQKLDGQKPVWFRRTDLTRPAEIEESFAKLEQNWGLPSVLVNVAGVFTGLRPFLDIDQATWDAEMNVNGRGLFFASQSAAKRMRRRGGGRIVNILSTASSQGFALASPYCASKGAALALTRVLAVELAGDNISVNGVGPGSVAAPTSESYLAETAIARHELERTPAGRLGEPEDIAEAVVFFACSSRWCTGQALYVDGGFMSAGLPYLDELPRPEED
jgi:NAD(P)-dependent dehydrogenase (short-subunit alcohol dehydrogenase family)